MEIDSERQLKGLLTQSSGENLKEAYTSEITLPGLSGLKALEIPLSLPELWASQFPRFSSTQSLKLSAQQNIRFMTWA